MNKLNKKFTLKDLHESDTDGKSRADMIAAGVLTVCPDDPELSVAHSLLFPVDELLPRGLKLVDGGDDE